MTLSTGNRIIAVVAALATVGLSLAVTSAAQADVTTTLNWESADQQGIPEQEPPGWGAQYDLGVTNPSGRPQLSLTQAGEPVRAGDHAARFELDRNDPGSTGGPRAELSGEVLTGEHWYGFSIYLPDSWAPDRAAEIVTQWHHTGLTGSPPLAIETQGGNWRVSQNWDGHEVDTPVGAYETGKWTDWVVHITWSSGNDGRLQIWKDGEPVPGFEDKRGQNSWDDEKAYMKVGIYKWPWGQGQESDTDNRVMFHDEVRIADASGSYEQVAPGGGAPPTC